MDKDKPLYKEPQGLNDVAKFHKTFNLPVLDDPQIPAKERCALRINLIEEELRELKEAIDNHDLVEVADAFCDIQYVLSGAILEFGLADKFRSLFDEVQRSNMSKTCKSLAEAEATLAHYKKEKDTDGYIKQQGDEYLVYRDYDGKVLKSINYSPADIEAKLNED